MAFNLTAQLNLVGPTNIKQIASQIKKDLGNINATVQFKLDPNVAKNVAGLSSSLKTLNSTFANTVTSATAASSAIKSFGNSINSIKINNIPQKINATANSITSLNKESTESVKALAGASSELVEFGKQAGLAVRRFVAFSAVTSIIYGVTNSINNGVQAFIDYDKELVKLQQVTGESASGLSKLQSQITNLSVAYGVSSKELTAVASTLAQAGLSARETEKALKALALSSLAPSFDGMNETVEGSIALMRQFGISAEDLEASLGSVNTVAARFAVESKDIITAIQRTGSVFATASKGVSEGKDALNEFIAVFTSVRATTRESAETIATGLRTIFTRVQRGQTIDALKEFGVNLTDAEGKFVGAYKAVELLSSGLNKLDPRSLDFSRIVEELGGFRQIGKVIPLIQQFAVTQEALKVAQRGQGSLARDAATAQLSLANQISKVREEFFALFREIGQSKGFQTLIRGALSLVSGLIKVTDAVKGILPALAVITAFKGAKGLTQFIGGFNTGVKRGPDGKANGGVIRKFARGGVVPGTGSGDTVPAMLEPGEFVIRKKAVETIGANNLHSMNKYGSGGSIRGGRSGKRKRFASGGPALSEIKSVEEVVDGDTFDAQVVPKAEPYTARFRLLNYDAYETGNRSSKITPDKWNTISKYPSNAEIKDKVKQTKDGNFKIPSNTIVGRGGLTAASAGSKATDDLVKFIGQTNNKDLLNKVDNKKNVGFGRIGIDLSKVFSSSYVTGRYVDDDADEYALGGKIQKFAAGGKVTRNLGYIDFDIINDPANAKLVEEQIKKSGSKGPREYTQYLTDLAIKAKKETSIKKLTALYGVAGAGKSSIAMGRGANDAGRLRETNRFPILTPEDISKASEVMLLTSTVSKDKLDGALKEADKIYALSTTTQEEKDRIRKQRMMRDVSGVGLFGRRAGATTGVPTDSAKEEALLTDSFGSKAMILGRGNSGRLRRKRGDELVQITKKKLGFTWGGFSPTTAGHESIMDAAKAAGIPYEDFIALVGANEAIDPQDDSYRTAIFDQDFRLLLAQAGFGAKGASVLPKAFGDMSVPLAFDMGQRDGRRQITLPAAGSMAFVADKTDKQMVKYEQAGYGVTNLERMGGISGTAVRKLLLAGNLEELQKVVSPGVFSLLKNNLPQLQNRSAVIPSLVQQAQSLYKQEVLSIDEQLAATGITRADNKKAATDPDYAAQLEIYQYLKEQKKKLATKASFEPYRLLKQLAEADPDKYALKLDRTGEDGIVGASQTSGLQEAILKKVAKDTSVQKSSGILPAQGSEILKRFGSERLPNDPSFGPFSGKTVRDTADGGKLKYWNSAFRPETKADKLAYYTRTRDYLIDKFNGSQGTQKATALKDTTSAVLSSTQLGLVGLNPLGYTGLLGPETWNLGIDPSGQERSIDASILQRGLPNQYQNVIDYLSGQTEEIVGGASKLLGIDPKKLTKKQRETLGQGNIEGALLEQIFGSADATILDDALRTRPIDFPMGIGPKAAKIFGIDPNIPTEVKRTIDSGSRGKAIKEFQRYFRQQYGIPQPAEEELQKLASGGQVNNIENRKYIGAGKYLSEDQVRYLDRLEKDRDKNIEERNKLSDALNDRLGGVYGGIIKNRKDSKSTNTGLNLDSNRLFGSQSSKEKELAVNDWYTGISKIGDRDFNRDLEQEMYYREKRFIELDAKVDPIAKQKEINELKKLELEAEKIEAEMFAIRKKAYSSKREKFASGGKTGALSGAANGELLKKYGEIFPSNNSTGPFKEMVFDFDDTLVTGGEIRLPDGRLDLSRKDDMPLVQEMLKKGKLTPLGQHLSEALKQEPSLMDNVSVLSARNPNQAGILAKTLQNLGLPIPASKIRGSNGPQNKKITGYQKMIDDNLETITRLKGQGHEAIHYTFAKGGKVEEEYKSILASILPKEMLTSDGYLKMPSGEAEPIDFIPGRSLAEKSRSSMMSILLGKAEKVAPEEQTGAFYAGGLMFKVLRHNLEKYKKKLPEDEYKALKQFVDQRILFEGNDDTIKTAGGLHKGVLAHESFHDIQGHLYDNHPEIIDKLHESLLKRKDAVEKWYKDPKNAEWAGPKDYRLEHFFPTATSKSPYSGNFITEAHDSVKKITKKDNVSQNLFSTLGATQWDFGKNELIPVLLSAAVENNKGAIELLSQAFEESGLNPDFYKTLPQKRKLGGVIRDIWHGTTTGQDDSVLKSFKKYGAKSDVSSGFGQGQGFYVYSDPTSAMVRAMELEGGANYLTAADPNGKPMALKFTELLDGKNWDLDYEFQNADIVNFIHSHYDRVKEAVAKSKGVDLGTNLKDFSLDQKYDEYLDTTDNTMMRKVGISFKDQGKDAERLLANNNYGDARSGEVLSSLVKSLMHSDPDFYEEFENSFFNNLKPKQGLKYVGKDPLKPVLAQIFTRQKNIDDTGWITEKFAKGGQAGVSPQDTVPALLTPGEFVINKKAAQNIGYAKLEKLNKADKIQGFNRGGAVGSVIQKFATGGSVLDMLLKGLQTFNQPSVQKLQSRPSETNSSTIEVSSEISSFSKNLADELDKAGYSMKSLKNIIEQMGQGADISYKQMEKALEKDLQRLKISGASIEATVQAEKALSDVRNQSKTNIVKRQFLEAGFKESKAGKALGSGASQQKILMEAEKKEKLIIAQRRKELTQSISSIPGGSGPPLSLDKIKEKVQELLDAEAQKIKENALIGATQQVTGIKKSELESMNIGSGDIKSYITQSTTDRKTLAQMDKQLIATRLEEYKNAGTVRGIAAQSASEALALAKEEVSKRRQIINEIAKEDGSKGVGAASLTDWKNSPVLNTLKGRYFDGDSGKFKGSTALGDIGMVAGLVGGQGENIANQMYDTRTDSGKVQAAKTSVAIQNAGSTLATGLTTAAQLAPINPVVAALVAVGTAAYAAADSYYDFTGAQADAAAAMEKSIRADKIAYATDVLNKSFETLMKSTTDLALKMDYVSKARTLIDLTKEDSNIEAATNKGDQERRTWSQYYWGGGPLADIGQAMGISSGNAYAKEGVNGLELQDYQRLGAKQAEAFASLGNQGYQLLPEAYKQGFSREDIIKNMDLSGEDNKTGITRAQVEAMVLSDPNKATEYQIRMAKGQDSGDRYLKEQTDNFFNTNAQALAAEKADKMARALEAANKAGRRLADSFELLSKNINESIGRTNFESEARAEAMKQNSDALRGKSESSGPKLRELNVLNNPSAYTDKEYDSALSSATSGIKNDRVKQQIIGGSQLEQRLPKAIKEAISTEVKGNANLDVDEATKLAIKAANAEIDKLNIRPEQKEDLKTIARTKIEEQAEKTRKTLAGKGDKAMVDNFLESLDSAKDITGDFSSKMSEVAKELLSFRQGALKQFAEGLNAASKALKDSRNYEKKARDIRNSGNMNFREVITGVGETFEERQARMNGDVASLTGGITSVAGIKNRMLSLQTSRQNIVKAQEATGGDPIGAAKLEKDLRAVDDQLRDTAEALDILATSTELVEKAFNDLKNVRELQKNRESFINTLLTNTPEEADKLNQTFIRLQRNLSGGLNDASNQRDARKAFNQTLRETGSVREATKAGNTVLANQRKETLAAMNDPGFQAAQELNIRNQYAQGKGKPGVSADEAVADYFKNQQLQVMKSMAVESGMINNPLVRQAIAAKEDPTSEPAMAQAADRYLKAVGLQSDATKAQGELALLESQQILAASNNNLKTSIDDLNARIDTLILGDAGGPRGIVGKDSIGQDVVQLASRGGLMYAQQGQYVNFQPKGTDTVPAMLTPGEFVVNARSTSEHLPLLKAINAGYFAKGGLTKRQESYEQQDKRTIREAKEKEQQRQQEELDIIREGYEIRTRPLGAYTNKSEQFEGVYTDRTRKAPNPLTDPAYGFLDRTDKQDLARIIKQQKEGTYKPSVYDMQLLQDLKQRASLQSGSYWAKENVPNMTAGEHGQMLSYISGLESKIKSYNMNPKKSGRFSSIPDSEKASKTWEGYVNIVPKLNRTDPDEPQQSFHGPYVPSKDKTDAQSRNSRDAGISTGITVNGKSGPVDILPGPLVSDYHFMSEKERNQLSRIMKGQEDGSYQPTNEDIKFINSMRERVRSLVKKDYDPRAGFGKSTSDKDPYWRKYNFGETGNASNFFDALEKQTRNYYDDPRYDPSKHQSSTDIVGRGFQTEGKFGTISNRPGPLGLAIMTKKEQERVARIIKQQEAGTYQPNEEDKVFAAQLNRKAQSYRNPATLEQYTAGDYGKGINFFEKFESQIKSYGKKKTEKKAKPPSAKKSQDMSLADKAKGQLAYARQQQYLSRFRPEVREQKEKDLLGKGQLYYPDGSSPRGKVFKEEGSRSTQNVAPLILPPGYKEVPDVTSQDGEILLPDQSGQKMLNTQTPSKIKVPDVEGQTPSASDSLITLEDNENYPSPSNKTSWMEPIYVYIANHPEVQARTPLESIEKARAHLRKIGMTAAQANAQYDAAIATRTAEAPDFVDAKGLPFLKGVDVRPSEQQAQENARMMSDEQQKKKNDTIVKDREERLKDYEAKKVAMKLREKTIREYFGNDPEGKRRADKVIADLPLWDKTTAGRSADYNTKFDADIIQMGLYRGKSLTNWNRSDLISPDEAVYRYEAQVKRREDYMKGRAAGDFDKFDPSESPKVKGIMGWLTGKDKGEPTKVKGISTMSEPIKPDVKSVGTAPTSKDIKTDPVTFRPLNYSENDIAKLDSEVKDLETDLAFKPKDEYTKKLLEKKKGTLSAIQQATTQAMEVRVALNNQTQSRYQELKQQANSGKISGSLEKEYIKLSLQRGVPYGQIRAFAGNISSVEDDMRRGVFSDAEMKQWSRQQRKEFESGLAKEKETSFYDKVASELSDIARKNVDSSVTKLTGNKQLGQAAGLGAGFGTGVLTSVGNPSTTAVGVSTAGMGYLSSIGLQAAAGTTAAGLQYGAGQNEAAAQTLKDTATMAAINLGLRILTDPKSAKLLEQAKKEFTEGLSNPPSLKEFLNDPEMRELGKALGYTDLLETIKTGNAVDTTSMFPRTEAVVGGISRSLEKIPGRGAEVIKNIGSAIEQIPRGAGGEYGFAGQMDLPPVKTTVAPKTNGTTKVYQYDVSSADEYSQMGEAAKKLINKTTASKVQKKANGGLIYAENGQLIDFSPKGTDTVPAMLTPGEFVVNAKSTKKNLGLLHSINRSKGGQIKYLSQGGRPDDTQPAPSVDIPQETTNNALSSYDSAGVLGQMAERSMGEQLEADRLASGTAQFMGGASGADVTAGLHYQRNYGERAGEKPVSEARTESMVGNYFDQSKEYYDNQGRTLWNLPERAAISMGQGLAHVVLPESELEPTTTLTYADGTKFREGPAEVGTGALANQAAMVAGIGALGGARTSTAFSNLGKVADPLGAATETGLTHVDQAAQGARRLVGSAVEGIGKGIGSETMAQTGRAIQITSGDAARAAARIASETAVPHGMSPRDAAFAHMGSETTDIYSGTSGGWHLDHNNKFRNTGSLGASEPIPQSAMGDAVIARMAEHASDIKRGGAGHGSIGSYHHDGAGVPAAYARDEFVAGRGEAYVVQSKVDKSLIDNSKSLFDDSLTSSLSSELLPNQSVAPVIHTGRSAAKDTVTGADVLTRFSEQTFKTAKEIAQMTPDEQLAYAAQREIAKNQVENALKQNSPITKMENSQVDPRFADMPGTTRVVHDPMVLGPRKSHSLRELSRIGSTHAPSYIPDLGDHVANHGYKTGLEQYDEKAKHHSSGGLIYANNGALAEAVSGTDTVPAMLTPGEFVVNRESSQKHMPILQAINNGYFNRGGIVNYLANGGAVMPQYSANGGPAKTGGGVSKDAASSSVGDALSAAVKSAVNDFNNSIQKGMESYSSMMQSSVEQMNSFGQTFSSATQTLANSAGTYSEAANNMPNTLKGEMEMTATQNVTGLGAVGEQIVGGAKAAGALAGTITSQNTWSYYDRKETEGAFNTSSKNKPITG